jgi:hypothetical protein
MEVSSDWILGTATAASPSEASSSAQRQHQQKQSLQQQSQQDEQRILKRPPHSRPDENVIPPAKLLTLDAAQALADGWDASDVLECYWLTRRVFLQGVANATISVTKTALGVRYRPPTVPGGDTTTLRREITLEYGPDRAGMKSQHDLLPVVYLPDNAMTDSSSATGNIPYVNWSNEGKVWYTTEIHAQQYESATYMASVTGAVVQAMLREAAMYTSRRGAKRYQPFQVLLVRDEQRSDPNDNGNVKEETATIKLRSSSDVDFVQHCLHHLATLGVVLWPVLQPTTYTLELTARKVSRETLTPTSKTDMAHFYARLYACVDQLASGLPAARIDDDGEDDDDDNYLPIDDDLLVPSSASLPTTSPTLEPRRRYRTLQDDTPTGNGDDSSTPGVAPSPSPVAGVPTYRPTSIRTPMPSVIVPPSPADPPPSATAEDAQKAAEEAQKAAQNATDLETAAQAAQQAVDAAQQAVDATVTQEALLRQEALLGGTAPEMTRTIALCFSDPLYGIRTSDAANASVPTFVYWDNSYYFAIDLVHPYARVVPNTWVPPHAVSPSDSAAILSSDGRMVDISLAFVMVGLCLLGVVLLCQRVSPSSAWRNQWLYKVQRWFFDPLHHSYDQDEEEEWHLQSSESRPLGQVGIPSSMGGGGGGGSTSGKTPRPHLYVGGNFRKRSMSAGRLSQLSRSATGTNTPRRKLSSSEGDLEMVTSPAGAAAAADTAATSGNGSTDMVVSAEDLSDLDMGDEEFLDEMSIASLRRFRDPNHVEMPDLSSSSKVAVPVSLKHHNSSHSRSSSSLPNVD